MRNNEKRVIVFDLDETLGCFVELGVFCDVIEKYNKKKLDLNEFYRIMDLFPEFLRPNMLEILTYLKDKKQQGELYKVFIYTNNQGPKEWTEKIRSFLEKKINYKLFDKVIGAYKVNGKIIEPTRTTHEKTISDFFRSTNLPKNTKICFIDDLYHSDMDVENVYYINIKPYLVSLPFSLMAERYYKQNMKLIDNKYKFTNFVNTQMKKYDLHTSPKSIVDNEIGKELMENLQNFLKISKKQSKFKTKKKQTQKYNSTRKKRKIYM